MTEVTIVIKAQITAIVKGDDAIRQAPDRKALAEWMKADFECDDVVIDSCKMFIREGGKNEKDS